ncbi:MAG: hypothetical protein NC244_06085 [Alistipes senegalensis]|nr:hypothetical protein [Alistipes senegalensis]
MKQTTTATEFLRIIVVFPALRTVTTELLSLRNGTKLNSPETTSVQPVSA